MTTRIRHIAGVGVLLAPALFAGCGKPNKANILLRKQAQSLQGEVAQLKRQHAADVATIEGLSQRTGTTPVLEPARLEKLFTVHGITLERLTGGADLDPSKPGDEGLKVYVGLIDQTGDEFKSTGSFTVDAFDLADPKSPALGHWEFGVDECAKNWHSFMMRYEYVLTCPWQNIVPRHPEVTVRVKFTDELTGRVFTGQRVATVHLPPTTQPAGAEARR